MMIGSLGRVQKLDPAQAVNGNASVNGHRDHQDNRARRPPRSRTARLGRDHCRRAGRDSACPHRANDRPGPGRRAGSWSTGVCAQGGGRRPTGRVAVPGRFSIREGRLQRADAPGRSGGRVVPRGKRQFVEGLGAMGPIALRRGCPTRISVGANGGRSGEVDDGLREDHGRLRSGTLTNAACCEAVDQTLSSFRPIGT
jgi:hypothetical protein